MNYKSMNHNLWVTIDESYANYRLHNGIPILYSHRQIRQFWKFQIETNKKNLKEFFFLKVQNSPGCMMNNANHLKKVYIARGAQESAGESKMINKYLMR